MRKKRFYVKAFNRIIEADVSLRHDRVIYRNNKGEIEMCSLMDFFTKLGAKELDEMKFGMDLLRLKESK